jgi:RHS repeat-associated protein
MFWTSEDHLALTPFRAYDPQLGRWLSRDPLRKAETQQGPNLYAYVANKSINEVDPLGLCCEFIVYTLLGALTDPKYGKSDVLLSLEELIHCQLVPCPCPPPPLPEPPDPWAGLPFPGPLPLEHEEINYFDPSRSPSADGLGTAGSPAENSAAHSPAKEY